MEEPHEETHISNQNHFRLSFLLANVANSKLRDLFRIRYKDLTNSDWVDGSAIAKSFLKSVGLMTYEKPNSEQVKLLQDGDITKWDLTLLASVIENNIFCRQCPQKELEYSTENKSVKSLRRVRNAFSHLPGPQLLPTPKFVDLWKSAESSLIALGVPPDMIATVKTKELLPVPPVKEFYMFDLSIPNFSGREDLLIKIHTRMEECAKGGSSSFTERTVLLHGLGGIGKSECARKYAQTHIGDPIIKNVAWIDAESETSLKASFVSLSKMLNKPTKKETLAQNIYHHFSEHIGVGLFIFDNAEQMNSNDGNGFGILKFLPTQFLKRSPLILITSRNIEWNDIPLKNKIVIEELNENEAVAFLVKSFQLSSEIANCENVKRAIRKLAHTLQGHALALTLAASNIRHNEWTNDICTEIDNYIKRMYVPDGGWINDTMSSGTANKYELIINNVWEVTLEKIMTLSGVGEDAIKLLNIMAYLPTDRLLKGNVEHAFKLTFGHMPSEDSLGILNKYSMISFYEVDRCRSIKLHRLVQQCTRRHIDPKMENEYILGMCKFVHQCPDWPDDLLYILEYLRELQWEGNLIQVSIICIASLMGVEDFISCALNALDRLCSFFAANCDHPLGKFQNQGSKLIKCDNLWRLLQLCIYYFRVDERFSRQALLFSDPNLSEEMLEPTFSFSLKSYMEHLANTEDSIRPDSVSEIATIYLHRVCYCLLMEPTVDFKQGLKDNIEELLISTANTDGGGHLGTIDEMCRLLWKLYLDDKGLSSPQYLELVVKKHFDFYPRIKDSSDLEEEIESYWRLGPIPYSNVSERLGRKDSWYFDRAVQNFPGDFMKTGCIRILLDHLNYLTTSKQVSHNFNNLSYKVLDFMCWMIWDLDFGDTLLQCCDFMNAFYNLTKVASLKTAECITISCLIVWFKLFTKNDSELRAQSSAHRSEWSLNSVTNEMQIVLRITDFSMGDLRWIDLGQYAVKKILKAYLRMHKTDEDSNGQSLSVRVAMHLVDQLPEFH